MTTEPGWESVIVRYSTFLLLTYIAKSLMIKTPNKVDQDVLNKAMASAYDERQLYNNLLMKHANDWSSVKTKDSTEQTDSSATNAYEITQMLWNKYRRSRCRSSGKQILYSDVGLRKEKRTEKDVPKNPIVSSPEQKSSTGEEGESSRMDHAIVLPVESASRCSVISQTLLGDKIRTTEPHGNNERSESVPSEKIHLFSFDKNGKCDRSAHVNVSDGEESLEEGEIRDSPRNSPKSKGVTHPDAPHSDSVTEISSSEDDHDTPLSPAGFNHAVGPGSTTYHQYYLHHQAVFNGYQNYHIMNYSQPPAAAQQILYSEAPSEHPTAVIEVSDEEPAHEETPVESFNASYEAIISLNSDEESTEKRQRTKRTVPLQLSPEQEKRKEFELKCSKFNNVGNEKPYLIGTDKSMISWPNTRIIRSGSNALWKWWRTHIEQNNGSLVIFYPAIGQIHGATPSLGGKIRSHVAVPKIVDDMNQFLRCLEKLDFPDHCSQLNTVARDACLHSNKKSARLKKILPLAEELSRGSIKRINFEISKKRTSFSIASNRITIKEFASIRHLTSTATKKYDLETTSEIKASSSSCFYSYGESTNNSSVPFSYEIHGPSHGNRPTSTKSDVETIIKRDNWSGYRSVKSASTKSSSEREKNVSLKTLRKRHRSRSSSSIDLSSEGERSPSETYRPRYPDVTERYPKLVRHRYQHWSSSSVSSRSEDSSPRRLKRDYFSHH